MAEKPYSSAKEIGPELEQAIGSLFVSAGAAEVALAMQVLRMMANPNPIIVDAVPLLSGMEVRVKLGIIRTYAGLKARDRCTRNAISKTADNIRDAFDRRNDFAHSALKAGDEADTVALLTMKVDRVGIPITKVYTKAQIEGFSQAIRSSVRALDEQLTRLGFRKLEELPLRDQPKPSR